MGEKDREARCDKLSKRAVDWIMKQLTGCHGTGYRGTQDLETDIYIWLFDHADFDE